jgi:hypothetical protein
VATDAPATTAFRKKLRREKFAVSAISALWNSIYQDIRTPKRQRFWRLIGITKTADTPDRATP